jgi:hypothetical protein
MGMCSVSQGIKRLGRGANHPLPTNVEVKERVDPLLDLHDLFYGEFTFFFNFLPSQYNCMNWWAYTSLSEVWQIDFELKNGRSVCCGVFWRCHCPKILCDSHTRTSVLVACFRQGIFKVTSLRVFLVFSTTWCMRVQQTISITHFVHEHKDVYSLHRPAARNNIYHIFSSRTEGYL